MSTRKIKAGDIVPGTVLVSISNAVNQHLVTIEDVIDAGDYVLLFTDSDACWEIGTEEEAVELT